MYITVKVHKGGSISGGKTAYSYINQSGPYTIAANSTWSPSSAIAFTQSTHTPTAYGTLEATVWYTVNGVQITSTGSASGASTTPPSVVTVGPASLVAPSCELIEHSSTSFDIEVHNPNPVAVTLNIDGEWETSFDLYTMLPRTVSMSANGDYRMTLSDECVIEWVYGDFYLSATGYPDSEVTTVEW